MSDVGGADLSKIMLRRHGYKFAEGQKCVGDIKGQNMVGKLAEMSWENCGEGSEDVCIK